MSTNRHFGQYEDAAGRVGKADQGVAADGVADVEGGDIARSAEQPIWGVYGKRPAANRAKKAMEALNG